MKLRQLFEALGEEVAIIFGRFNPPHKGHRAAWELASKSPIWYVGTNQSTVGPKDPLPFDVKVEAMKTIWPDVEGHIVAEQSWLTLASKVYKEKPNATLLCLTDEDWVTKTIQQYNGVEGPHGYYDFKKIEQKPTPRLSSATALRAAVQAGDREAFADAAGVPADTPVAGKPFFDLVAEYLLPYANAPKKVAKKKVAVPAEGVEEGHDAYGFHSAVGKGKFLPSKFGNKRFVYLHDLENESPSTGGPQLVTIDDAVAAKEIANQYGGKVVKTKLGTFRIVQPATQGVATEDAAGVGIITKQNSTVDVNKGTPRKNLKAFKLVK